MPITQGIPTAFKQELLTGTHAMTTDTIKCALFTSAATLNASTTQYSATNESSGTGYTAGGNTLTSAVVAAGGTTAYVDFADTSWVSSSVTARGALIYNSSKSNKAIAVLDFGSDKTSSNSTFQITFPAPDASNAIIRLT